MTASKQHSKKTETLPNDPATEARPAASLVEAFLRGTAFPYAHTFEDGPCAGLTIQFRDLPGDLPERLVEALGEELSALGFDPYVFVLVNCGGADGVKAVRDDEFEALRAREDSLTAKERLAVRDILRRANGLFLASVVGAWSDPAPLTPDALLALPRPVQAKIGDLALSPEAPGQS